MPLRLSLTYTFPAAPERLWPIVADTDRLNRVLGLPDMRYQPLAGESEVGRLKVRARQLALVAFEEEPFEWVENESYRVRRHFPSGPFQSFEGGKQPRLKTLRKGLRGIHRANSQHQA